MAKDLQTLIDARDLLRQKLKLHDLKGESLRKRLDTAISAVQAVCDHSDVETTYTYHGGGYDYCAETRYRTRCLTCGHVVKKWTETHPGIYG